MVAGCATCGGTPSSSDERDELQERDRSVGPDLDLLLELVHLPVIDQQDEPVAVERSLGQLELSLGVYRPPTAHLEAVQGPLSLRRLDETVEVLGLVEVVVVHLPVDTGADQLTHRDLLVRYVEREVSIVITAQAESRFVPDLQRRRHGHTPSSKPSGNVYEAYGLLHTTTRGKSLETARIRESRDARVHTDVCQACSACSPFGDVWGRSHTGTWKGCIVSLALHTTPPFSAGGPSSTCRR